MDQRAPDKLSATASFALSTLRHDDAPHEDASSAVHPDLRPGGVRNAAESRSLQLRARPTPRTQQAVSEVRPAHRYRRTVGGACRTLVQNGVPRRSPCSGRRRQFLPGSESLPPQGSAWPLFLCESLSAYLGAPRFAQDELPGELKPWRAVAASSRSARSPALRLVYLREDGWVL